MDFNDFDTRRKFLLKLNIFTAIIAFIIGLIVLIAYLLE
jgi:hypothetical protein